MEYLMLLIGLAVVVPSFFMHNVVALIVYFATLVALGIYVIVVLISD